MTKPDGIYLHELSPRQRGWRWDEEEDNRMNDLQREDSPRRHADIR
jgi:hypothetical protein